MTKVAEIYEQIHRTMKADPETKHQGVLDVLSLLSEYGIQDIDELIPPDLALALFHQIFSFLCDEAWGPCSDWLEEQELEPLSGLISCLPELFPDPHERAVTVGMLFAQSQWDKNHKPLTPTP